MCLSFPKVENVIEGLMWPLTLTSLNQTLNILPTFVIEEKPVENVAFFSTEFQPNFCSGIMWYIFFYREEQKHLKRASVVIGVIATLIFLLCVAMVAVTLHFTPVMNRFASKCLF